jgi:ATP-dependent helicase HrpA
VRLTAFDTEDKARAEHRKGLSRLFALQLAAQVKAIEKLPGLREMALQFISLGTEKELREQLVAVTLERTCLMEPLPAEESAFAARRDAARGRILLVAQEILRLVGTVLTEHAAVTKKLAAGMQKAFPQAAADIAAQLAELMPKRVHPRHALRAPAALPALPQGHRPAPGQGAQRPGARRAADGRLAGLGKPWERERNAMLKGGQPHDAFLDEFRWLLEELRVALFAQELKTSSPVSVKRLQKMWEGRER